MGQKNAIRSMTGYGRGESTHEGFHYVVEIKAVNSRHCEVKTHSPREFIAWEHEITAHIRRHFQRGRFDVFVQVENSAAQSSAFNLRLDVADAYVKGLEQLSKRCGIKSEITLSHLLSNKDLFASTKMDPTAGWQDVLKALEIATQKLRESGEREAKSLLVDIEKRLLLLTAAAEQIEKNRPQLLKQVAARLSERIQVLLGERKLDQDRLEQEIALLVDRSDITEELVRLKSHLVRLKELLNQAGVVGKECDFIVQEIHREINTLGQKTPDYDVAQTVIQMKSTTEKIREQVQNLE